ncbi:glycosyltransferase family 2 protein [Sphingomonas immobilis]|uniref:Glycosyltransferase family 2 protein n=1 Tax=Sphingomonas immobilis TaxID=3063997 RepID=A0ABT9A450_9SPHN|nr:glycosyltransferase family 2 protein [Sphingomonas sp. CA1-15]MDO7844614.1 glycosyltransferase family 2 protein [Sphingomonas sp. CA1-15]
MITMVVPTRNRAYTLRKVLPTYLAQDKVSEIILVDDDGEDDTEALLQGLAPQFPAVTCRYLRNPERRGASYGRQRGAEAAANDFVLFCDDDEYLEAGYAAKCLELMAPETVGAVSGRRVYMRDGEQPEQAVRRFGNGTRKRRYFEHFLLQIINGARFTGVIEVPFTVANILTRKALLERFPFDSHYAKGNGYREESDYQMNLYVNGYTILVTNDAHSIHMPYSEVRTGGQRIDKWRKFRWSVHYNNYFIDKYYAAYRKRSGVWYPAPLAKLMSGSYLYWRGFIRPQVYKVVTKLTDKRVD